MLYANGNHYHLTGGTCMVKIVLTAALAILAAGALGGCNTQTPPPPPDSGILVYASVYPMYDFAVKIGGDKATVAAMLPQGSEPHDWEPTPADIAALEKADVFIYNGAGLEDWVDTVLEAHSGADLVVVETSAAVELLSPEEDGHDHNGNSGHSHDSADPHVWLSPGNARKQMEAISHAFSQADPDNAGYYRENFQRYAAELDALDKEFRDTLDPLPRKEIVVAHQAFGYLCHDYGLTQVGVRGFSPDGEPDPGQMAQVISYAREHNIKVIFYEEAASAGVAEAIAGEIGGTTDILSPVELLTDGEQAAGDDYFSVMRRNLAALKRALQ